MRTATANAIKMLLRTDTTVSSDVRTAITSIISGARSAKTVKLDATIDLSLTEAADVLRINRVTLWRMCDRGEIDVVRRGHKIYIPGREVVRLKGGASPSEDVHAEAEAVNAEAKTEAVA